MGKTPDVDVSLFSQDWHDGLMIAEICQRHRLTKDQAVRLRIRLGLPPRLSRAGRRRGPPPSVPNPAEILARAAEIRKGWTAEIEAKRAGREDAPYEIPRDVETPDDFDPRWYD